MKRIIYLLLTLLLAYNLSTAQTEVRFHNEKSDTTRLTTLLDRAAKMKFKSPEERVAFFGRQFIGTPYGAHTLEGEQEILTVNLDSLDCTTFVETAMALAYTIVEQRTSWRDFIYNLRRLRYRNGEVDGYPSRLHYIADWVVDESAQRQLPRCYKRISAIQRNKPDYRLHVDKPRQISGFG